MSISDIEEEEKIIRPKPKLRLLIGGKEPPSGGDKEEDWLSSMKRYTVFLAHSRNKSSLDLLDLLEYHVIIKTRQSIQILVKINDTQITKWVEPRDFCKKFVLHETIYEPIEEKDE